MTKIWTYQERKIEQAEEELRRWKEEKYYWCDVSHDITRQRDSCEKYESKNIGDILIPTCNSCIHWDNEINLAENRDTFHQEAMATKAERKKVALKVLQEEKNKLKLYCEKNNFRYFDISEKVNKRWRLNA